MMPPKKNSPTFVLELGLVTVKSTVMFRIWPNLMPYLKDLINLTKSSFDPEV